MAEKIPDYPDPPPLAVASTSDLLYPEGEIKFKEISEEVWLWLQEAAARKLLQERGGNGGNDAWRRHWQSIVAGTPPYGLRIRQGHDAKVV